MTNILCFMIFFIIGFFDLTKSDLYHIAASSSDPCPAQPCLTLSQFATNTSNLLDSSTILIFLPGNHILDKNVSASDIWSFKMISDVAFLRSLSDTFDTNITCEPSVMFKFNNVTLLYINGIQFVGCGGNRVESVHSFILGSCSFIGEGANRSALELVKTTAYIGSTSFISNYNHVGTRIEVQWMYNNYYYRVSGALIVNQSNVSIFNSRFNGNRAERGGAIYSETDSNITIANSSFIDNHAHFWQRGSLPLIITSDGGVMYLDHTILSINYSYFDRNSAQGYGGVIFVHGFTIYSTKNSFCNNSAGRAGGVFAGIITTISSSNNSFYNNRATDAGVFFGILTTIKISYNFFKNNSAARDGGVISGVDLTMNCSNNIFYSNRATDGGAVLLLQTGVQVIFSNNKFYSNTAEHDGGAIRVAAVHVGPKKRTSTIASNNDYFYNNSAGHNGGAIAAFYTYTLSSNNCKFDSNKAGGCGGVLWTTGSVINATYNIYVNNQATDGGVIFSERSTINSFSNDFFNNSAYDGGAMAMRHKSTLNSNDNYFHFNRADNNGGVTVLHTSNMTSINSYFYNNSAGIDGGVLWGYQSTIDGYNDTFFFNSASRDGGVIYSHSASLEYKKTTAYNNRAGSHGGVFRQLQGTLKVTTGNFTGNSAKHGGAMSVDRVRPIELNDTLFSSTTGSVFYASGSELNTHRKTILLHNTATSAVAYFVDSNLNFSGNTTLLDNKGSIVVIASKVSFSDYVILAGGKVSDQEIGKSTAKFETESAITAIQSKVIFGGLCQIRNNQARIGGAIRSRKSIIRVKGDLTITSNSATESGGGIYLYQSELTCQFQSKLVLRQNTASQSGGGIYAISSSINVKSNRSSTGTGPLLHFVKNRAKRGGGVYLQMNSVIYITKYSACKEAYSMLSFTNNRADYGGAVFIPDNTKFGECTEFENETHSNPNECPFQVMSLYGQDNSSSDHNLLKHIQFIGNTAIISGSSLYGGFFESCTVSQLAEGNTIDSIDANPIYYSSMDELEVDEIRYLHDISDVTYLEIGTPPVKVCFCKDNEPDCSYQHLMMHTETINVLSLAAFDEMNNVVKRADVLGYFNKSNNGSFLHVYKQNINKSVNSNCSDFVFTAFSIHHYDKLILHADPGPCEHFTPHEIEVTVQFPWCENCSVGFQRFEDKEQGCRCDCHEVIKEHFINCNATTQNLLKKSSAWISYVNEGGKSSTSGFIIYPHCPLDYCKPTDSAAVYVNFNEENGADSQCAYSRSGTLCGSCPHNLSLSLGSSQCLACPKLWPLLSIAIILLSVLLGVFLVTLLIALNLTVAVGTINAIIFYVNIVAANSKLLLPLSKPNFATVFVSWLNLEFGLDLCFFKGLDVYWKTWLQIAFPTYIILLVVMVIILSEQSIKFANLIGKRNPIATLTTLILLSYTRLLHSIIAAFSFTTLKYPDGSRHTVWLPDGTVGYLSGKHIALFVAALLILMLGIVYTGLLFSWQWLLRYQHKKIFKWVRNQKLCQFLEPYHAPYKFKHRYWTGLLLFVRVVLYVVSATNVSGDPRVALVSTICLVGFLLLLKGSLAIQVYKNSAIDLMETITYFNLMLLSAFSWYSLEGGAHARRAVAYTSVSATIIMFITLLIYHVHTYTGAFQKCKISAYFNKFSNILKDTQNNVQDKNKYTADVEEDYIHDRVNPTYSTVEIHKPKLQETGQEWQEAPHDESNMYTITATNTHLSEIQCVESENVPINGHLNNPPSSEYRESNRDTEQISDISCEIQHQINNGPKYNLSNGNYVNRDTFM